MNSRQPIEFFPTKSQRGRRVVLGAGRRWKCPECGGLYYAGSCMPCELEAAKKDVKKGGRNE